jgi:hypothetical protein
VSTPTRRSSPRLMWFGGGPEYSDASLLVEPPLFRR